MIEIEIKPREVVIKGHAQSAPAGQDLVCCAVSTLYYSLVANLLANVKDKDDVEFDGKKGNARVKVKDFNRECHRCFKFFKIAVVELQKQHKKYIKIL